MESVLAMMVVICGVMLVTTSLSFVGIGLLRDSSSALLQEGCRSVSDQFFSLGRPFFEAEVLQNSSLFMLNTSLFHCGTSVRGFCIALQDVTAGTTSIAILRTGEMSSGNDTRSETVPVLLSMADRTTHAARVTVIVWL
jgi:hypothetical protein